MTFFKVKENITAFIAVLIALFTLITSFVGTDAEVYLFPRIAAVIISILAIAMLTKVLMNRDNEVVMTSPLINWKTLWPCLLIGIIYVTYLSLIAMKYYRN